MVNVAQIGGNIWIESITIDRATVLTSAVRVVAFSISRAGNVMAISATADSDEEEVRCMIRKQNNNQIGEAQLITNVGVGSSLECVMFNDESGSAELGAHILIVMRGLGKGAGS